LAMSILYIFISILANLERYVWITSYKFMLNDHDQSTIISS
jgi:hypothetical protein